MEIGSCQITSVQKKEMFVFFKSKIYLGSQYPTKTFRILYGELMQIFSLPEPICRVTGWRWMLTVQYADIMRKRSAINFGNVRLRQMCGHRFEERFRNVRHRPKILSCWYVTLWQNWQKRSWRAGPLQHVQYEMQKDSQVHSEGRGYHVAVIVVRLVHGLDQLILTTSRGPLFTYTSINPFSWIK